MRTEEKYYKGEYLLAFYSLYSNYDKLIGQFDNMSDLASKLGIKKDTNEYKTLKSRVIMAIGHKKLHGEPKQHFYLDNHACKCFLISMLREQNEEVLI